MSVLSMSRVDHQMANSAHCHKIFEFVAFVFSELYAGIKPNVMNNGAISCPAILASIIVAFKRFKPITRKSPVVFVPLIDLVSPFKVSAVPFSRTCYILQAFTLHLARFAAIYSIVEGRDYNPGSSTVMTINCDGFSFVYSARHDEIMVLKRLSYVK